MNCRHRTLNITYFEVRFVWRRCTWPPELYMSYMFSSVLHNACTVRAPVECASAAVIWYRFVRGVVFARLAHTVHHERCASVVGVSNADHDELRKESGSGVHTSTNANRPRVLTSARSRNSILQQSTSLLKKQKLLKSQPKRNLI